MDKTAKLKEKIMFFNREIGWQAAALILLVFCFLAILILIEDKITLPQNFLQNFLLKEKASQLETEVPPEKDASLVGQIYFNPSEQIISLGERATVEVWIDSQEKKLDSIDIILNYQPELIKIISLEKTDLFGDYPELNWDEEKGKIVIRAISLQDNEFSGKGMVAQINFQPLQPGKAKIGVDFAPQKTLDSNLVETGISQDILGEAKESLIEIKK